MASSSKSNNKEEEEEKKKKKKNKHNIKAATPTKTTPQKSPINKTHKKSENQEKHKIKKKKKTTENDSVTDVFEIPSSSCDSQDIQEDEPKKNHTTKSPKPDKRNQKARDDYEDEGDGTMCKFPMARIKRIMKSEDPTLQLPQDVVFIVNKATEKFIEQFCEEAYDCSVQDRKKSLAYKHLSSVVSKNKRFDFLSDYVPVKLKAKAALEQRKLVEDGQI